MTIRMVIVLSITLYTTRAVLQILGIEDYGVYNVVCGFVSMFSFLSTSMSNGVQRFFNFELGKNGEVGANRVYCTALTIQVLLALFLAVIAETIGLWYLHSKMVIPEERLLAAEWIFQMSIVSFVLLVIQAPYGAAIMAHERMEFYAFVSVLDAILKLAIVFILPFIDFDNLIVYGVLLALISLLNFLLYYIYCKKNFIEIKYKFLFDKQLFNSMLGFSGWNIFGTLAGVMKEHGINLVLNLFFGPVVNAARGVANQINGGLLSFVNNITIPVRPQIVQSYAAGNTKRTLNLMFSISKLSCCSLYLLSLPIILELDYILQIWLENNIPEHTYSFAIIIILISFVNNLNSAVSSVVHASGVMKKYQTQTSFISLLCVPAAYITLKIGYKPEVALVMVLLFVSISQWFSLKILQGIVYFKLTVYFKNVFLPFSYVVITSFFLPIVIKNIFETGMVRLVLVTFISGINILISIYLLGLNKSEKELITQLIQKIKK